MLGRSSAAFLCHVTNHEITTVKLRMRPLIALKMAGEPTGNPKPAWQDMSFSNQPECFPCSTRNYVIISTNDVEISIVRLYCSCDCSFGRAWTALGGILLPRKGGVSLVPVQCC